MDVTHLTVSILIKSIYATEHLYLIMLHWFMVHGTILGYTVLGPARSVRIILINKYKYNINIIQMYNINIILQ